MSELPSPSFPPLLDGEAVRGDPFALAQARAAEGCDAGLILYTISRARLRAAIVFAPEVPLSQAATMLITCGIGFSNALGALAPPEVGVHLDWDGGIRVNGAHCGRLAMAASTHRPEDQPDWLVIGLTVSLATDTDDPGLTPDQTSLLEEGCADIPPMRLLESWARHTLVWLNRWLDDGPAPLAAEWRGMVHGIDAETTQTLDGAPLTGTFLGVDEDFGMLLRTSTGTRSLPLTTLLS